MASTRPRRWLPVIVMLLCVAVVLFRLQRTADQPIESPPAARNGAATLPRVVDTELEGQVLGCYGTPLPGVLVELVSGNASKGRQCTTQADGTFRFESIPVGRHRVRATSDRWGRIERNASLPFRDELVLRFPGTARIVGRIHSDLHLGLKERGQKLPPLRLKTIRLFRQKEKSRTLHSKVKIQRVSMEEGDQFDVDGLGIGEFVLEGRSGMYILERPVAIERNGEVMEIDLHLADALPIDFREMKITGTAFLGKERLRNDQFQVAAPMTPARRPTRRRTILDVAWLPAQSS